MLALFLMLFSIYYAQHYAGIIGAGVIGASLVMNYTPLHHKIRSYVLTRRQWVLVKTEDGVADPYGRTVRDTVTDSSYLWYSARGVTLSARPGTASSTQEHAL